MIYSKSILGKVLEELTFQDIIDYFQNPQQESNIAEYKSFNPRGDFDQKFIGIYQAVCALLNSEGGIIIWGAPVGQHVSGRKEKIFSGDLTPINRIVEKDYLINRISDNITPLPNNINARIIERNEECVIVIEVEKSIYSPHQTQNVYYMRLDGQSKPAPHHYIEALFKQIRYPELGGYIKFESIETDGTRYFLGIKIFVMNHSSILNEENVSFRLTCNNGIFNNQYPSGIPTITLNGHQLHYDNYADIMHYGSVPFCDATIIYNPYDLANNNYETNLMIAFGGRKSPMKSSEYKLRLNNINPSNINDLVYDISENKLMYERAIDKGTEIEKVNMILGR